MCQPLSAGTLRQPGYHFHFSRPGNRRLVIVSFFARTSEVCLLPAAGGKQTGSLRVFTRQDRKILKY